MLLAVPLFMLVLMKQMCDLVVGAVVNSMRCMVVHGLHCVVLGCAGRLLVHSLSCMRLDGLLRVVLSSFFHVALGCLSHVVVARSVRGHQFVLLLLRRVNDVDYWSILMARPSFAACTTTTTSTHSRDHVRLSEQFDGLGLAGKEHAGTCVNRKLQLHFNLIYYFLRLLLQSVN